MPREGGRSGHPLADLVRTHGISRARGANVCPGNRVRYTEGAWAELKALFRTYFTYTVRLKLGCV